MISLFDLFKIGIGPSSSHTVGPMRAACRFAENLAASPALTKMARLRVTLYGSLAWTAEGHGTDKAVILGLCGEHPETVDPAEIDAIVKHVRESGEIVVQGPIRAQKIRFQPVQDLVLDYETQPPRHPNTLQLEALDDEGNVLEKERYCSVGGGFIVSEDAVETTSYATPDMPYDFTSGVGLLALTQRTGKTIAELVLANESALVSAPDAPAEAPQETEVIAKLDRLIDVMMASIDRGIKGGAPGDEGSGGVLPGRLGVRRRAPALHARLLGREKQHRPLPHDIMDWVSLFAIAVNEENAAGSRVVTAPTNGAAGVVPAVLRYYRDFCPDASQEGMRIFMLTAGALGGLFKLNASISGAEVGCQGEVGVASSMAAAGLAAALGASPAQIENAAESAMEHHLGLTCDPVAGLVQIPCIERNAFGAIKAINAASLAMCGNGDHRVSLDQVIRTMAETGRDMNHRYKETSLGGLALNFPEC